MMPNYVLRDNEVVWKSPNESRAIYYIRKAVEIIAILLVILSLIFRENIFMELSLNARIIFIMLVVYIFFINKGKPQPSPFEIQFYDEYMVVYREKRYYSPVLSRMEIIKIPYNSVRRCLHRTVAERINIYGVNECLCYKYKKDGTVAEKPYFHKTTDSICWFHTYFSQSDFVAEIEAHTPLKFEIQNN